MPYGYNGKILRVNLTEGKVASEELPETFYRLYFGGEGMVCISLFEAKRINNVISLVFQDYLLSKI
jgi:aldehyde:ferredoxin oxidoreductase